MLPGLHGQGQHQVAAVAQQAVKLLHFNKEADRQYDQQADERCQVQQHQGQPGQRKSVRGILDKMAQDTGENVQHQHTACNRQDNAARGLELVFQ